MKYFALIGMTILLMSGCEFIQGEPPEPTATSIPLVKIDSDDEFNELTRTDTDSNIVKWELDFKDKYIDFSNLGAFEVVRIYSDSVFLKNIRVEKWTLNFEVKLLNKPTPDTTLFFPTPIPFISPLIKIRKDEAYQLTRNSDLLNIIKGKPTFTRTPTPIPPTPRLQ